MADVVEVSIGPALSAEEAKRCSDAWDRHKRGDPPPWEAGNWVVEARVRDELMERHLAARAAERAAKRAATRADAVPTTEAEAAADAEEYLRDAGALPRAPKKGGRGGRKKKKGGKRKR